MFACRWCNASQRVDAGKPQSDSAGAMLRGLIAGVLMFAAVACSARSPATPVELPTTWEVPPGDPLELMTAGFAKILCSALFITGRSLATATEEDGFFVSPHAERRMVTDTTVDWQERAVH